MSVTLLATGGALEPVFTEIPYKVSTNIYNTYPEMQFVVDTYVRNVTASTDTRVARLKFFPKYSDSTLTFSPSAILENFISPDLNYFSDYWWQPAINSIKGYRVTFGEEWSITAGTVFTSVTSNSGYAQLHFGTDFINVANTFYVGDTLKINSDVYDYFHTVRSVDGSGKYTLNTSYSGNSTGTCVYRLTTVSGITWSAHTYNAAADYSNIYESKNGTHNLLTPLGANQGQPLTEYDASTEIKIQSNERYPLGVIAIDSGNRPDGFIIMTYVDFNLAGYYNIPNDHIHYSGNTNIVKWTFDAGTKRLENITRFNYYLATNTQVLPSNITHYKVCVYKNGFPGGIQISDFRTFRIDTTCRSNKIRFNWVNTKGDTDCFNFYQIDEKTQVNQETFTKKFDSLAFSQSERNALANRGERALNTNVKREIIAQTEPISIAEYNVLRTLYYSPEVYILDETNGSLIPVIITNNDIPEFEIDTPTRLEIKFRYANKLNTLRG